MADPNNPNPRRAFVEFLDGLPPHEVEELVDYLKAVKAATAFTEVRVLCQRLAEAQDPKAAAEAARAEVEKRPTKPGVAPRVR